MPGYAAFLRAVNFTGRRLSNAELRAPFEALGLDDVQAFRASGNVIFHADDEADTLGSRLESALEDALGYEVAVFLRTADEVRAIAGHDPFPRDVVDASKGKLQVTMLSAAPDAATRKQVLALASDEDLLAFGNRELYWLPSGGTQESRLDMKAIGRLLGPTTMRTKGTVEQIAAKYFPA